MKVHAVYVFLPFVLSIYSAVAPRAARAEVKGELVTIPSDYPREELVWGDLLRFKVSVKDQASLTKANKIVYGGHNVVLNWDEKEKALVGELEVPRYNLKPRPVPGIELKGVGGLTAVYQIPKEAAQRLVQKSSAAAGRPKLLYHYEGPKFPVPEVDNEPPLVNAITVIKISNEIARVNFQASDPSGIADLKLHVMASDPERDVPARRIPISVVNRNCEGDGVKGLFCQISLKLPETIGGLPAMILQVKDSCGNEKLYTSAAKDFVFQWPSRALTPEDTTPPKVKSISLVRQVGNQVVLALQIESLTPIRKIEPLLSYPTEEAGKLNLETYLSDEKVDLQPGARADQLVLTMPLPPFRSADENWHVALEVNAMNGTTTRISPLPREVELGIDFGRLPEGQTLTPEITNIAMEKIQ